MGVWGLGLQRVGSGPVGSGPGPGQAAHPRPWSAGAPTRPRAEAQTDRSACPIRTDQSVWPPTPGGRRGAGGETSRCRKICRQRPTSFEVVLCSRGQAVWR